MIQIRIPGDIDVSTRFFARFTPRDIARIATPVLFVYAAGLPLTWFIPAAVVSATWYLFRPYDKTLDQHLIHAARWLTTRKTVEGTDIKRREDSCIVTDQDAVVGVIEVEPCSLEMKTEPEQAALHQIYKKTLETVSYPIQIHSQQQELDLEGYIDSLQEKEPERLRKSYTEHCQQLSQKELVNTRHYITVHVPPQTLNRIQEYVPEELHEKLPFEEQSRDDTLDSQKAELETRIHQITEELNTGELKAERVTGEELSRFARNANQPKPNNHPRWNTQAEDGNGEYSRTLTVTELPSTAELGWIKTVLQTPGRIDVTQVVEPESSPKATKNLNRAIEKLDAEIDSFLAAGYRGTNKLETLLQDAEWMLDLLADREDQPFNYGVYITVHDKDREKCLQTFDRVKNRLDTMQIGYREPVLRTDQALKTRSPLYSDTLDEKMLVPGRSAAAGFPFTTQETGEDGVIHGVDAGDRTPILLDRFELASHSMARMGTVGSGKSFAAKLELIRSHFAYPDLRIIVIDPKKEYTHVVKRLDGNVQTVDKGNDYSFDNDVVSFEVDERGEDNVEELTQLVREVYNATSQNREKTLVLMDEARILLNDEEGRRVLNQFVLEGRDTNTAVTLVTQNASHFTYCREGREILDNMPAKIFMKHERVPDDVIDYFQLSQREVQKLHELKTGTDSPYSEALIKVSGKLDTRIKVEATGREKTVIE